MPGLEAGRALLQGCKAVGNPFPLRVVFALDIFINLFSRTAADCPHQPKAFPPLSRHIETLATSLPGNLEKGRWISLEGPFSHKVSALEKDLRHSWHDIFSRFGHHDRGYPASLVERCHSALKGEAGLDDEAEIWGLCV